MNTGWFVLLALVVETTAASGCKEEKSSLQPSSFSSPATATATAASAQPNSAVAWTAKLAQLDTQIKARRQRAIDKKTWLDWELVSLMEAERARLGGDYRSYVRALQALDEAFKVAPKGAGPFATRAGLNMGLHRLSLVEPDLIHMEAAAVLTADDKGVIASLRGDVAYYSGELKTAEVLYSKVANEIPSVRSLSALARLEWKTGDVAAAEAWLDKATQAAIKATTSDRAWLLLMRGLMKLDQNKLDEALVFYKEGLKLQPGYWLLEEHVAEILLRKGQVDEALDMYKDLVARTHNPEFMDQIASIYADRDDETSFANWRDQARAVHEKRLALVPEAALGHALDHYLEHEQDHAESLRLALQNHKTRPGGEAKEKLIAAYVLANELDKATETAAAMKKTGWKTPDGLALSALAHKLSGNAQQAEQDEAAAIALASDAMERISWLSGTGKDG